MPAWPMWRSSRQVEIDLQAVKVELSDQLELSWLLSDAERIFRRIDANGDGTISAEEVADFHKQAGLR